MPKKVVIVESPNKCKTIEKLLGSDFKVIASCGHICDLDKRDYVDIDNNFKPRYIVVKKDVVSRIKAMIKNCDEVIIGTDLDREGEAIGYHLLRVLKLPVKTTKRMIFNEITKSALTKAYSNPSFINEDIFNAYQARIILDKLLGFKISPVLWKYIKDRTSAGRCQSPALSLVLDRELEIDKFIEEEYYSVESEFGEDKDNIQGKLTCRIRNDELNEVIDTVKKSQVKIISVGTKIKKIYPPSPYITSSVQQDASQNLGLSPQMCNNVLKQLYEKAKITYPRTDLDELSEEAKDACKDEIIKRFGKKYLGMRKQRKKKKKENTQEAHEAIRPVDLSLNKIDELSDLEQKMYYMIWKRTIQSQMANRENEILEVTVQMIDKKTNKLYKYCYNIIYTSCRFDGYSILNTGEKSELDIDKIKELFSIGNKLNINKTIYKQQFTKPKTRLTEADLIKLLEKKGIGRPSTFASIIATLINRSYIEVKNTDSQQIDCVQIEQIGKNIEKTTIQKNVPGEKRKIFITTLGKNVCEFLVKHFGLIMNYEYTSDVNKRLDVISDGKLIWHELVKAQYQMFMPIVDGLIQSNYNKGDNSELIGTINNIDYYKYNGKFGWTIKWTINNSKKPCFIKIPDKLLDNIDNLTIENIIDIIPVNLGKYNKYDVLIKSGPYGHYINWNKKNVSIKDKNINYEQAIELLSNNKQEKTNSKVLKEIKQYKVINGPYGIFITNGKKNKKLGDNIDIKDIDIKYCNSLFKWSKGGK